MGIIIKQSIKGTFYAYLGVFIGFITSGILFPKFLTVDQVGLINLLVAYAIVFAQIGSLGMNYVTTRLFPFFRNKEIRHNNYFIILILVAVTGYVLVSSGLAIFKPLIIERNIEKSLLFTDYINLLFPFIFFYLIFSVIDNYIKVLYNATLGILAKELIIRLIVLVVFVLYIVKFLKFNAFINVYVYANVIPVLVLLIYIWKQKQFFLKPTGDWAIFHQQKKSMFFVGLTGIIAGFSSIIISTIDRIMVNSYEGLGNTGVYSIGLYFATLILIPSRSLVKISSALIADAWKTNEVSKIKEIYTKSSINQFIIALLLFIGIYINMDAVIAIIGEEYSAAEQVILFLAIGNLVHMGTGVNGTIIETSVYYRYQTYFIIIMGVLVIASNFVLIPAFGIIGAACASSISLVLVNLIRCIFLYMKFKMHPFSIQFIPVILIGIITYFSANYLPGHHNPFISILIKGTFVLTVYSVLIYITRVSKDINSTAQLIVRRFLEVFNRKND